MSQIACGLEYLHSQEPQVIHGDLRAVRYSCSVKFTAAHFVRRVIFYFQKEKMTAINFAWPILV